MGELLTTVGIIIVLSAATVIILNPVSFIQESKDARRISDLNNLKIAVEKYKYSGLGNLSLGSVNTLYISIPDSSTTCANLGLPAISGWSYKCAPTSTFKNVDGTGWIPIDFTRITSVGPFISDLPIDETNAVSTSNFYAYAVDSNGGYILTALLESEKKIKEVASGDGGGDPVRFEAGMNLFLSPNDPKLWLKADSLNLSNNDPISTWDDLSGNNNDAIQSNVSYKPLFKTNQVNGKSVVQFDGANDSLAGGALGVSGSGASSVFFVGKSLTWYEDGVKFFSFGSSSGAGGTTRILYYRNGPFDGVIGYTDGYSVMRNTGFDYSNFGIFSVTNNSGDRYRDPILRYNGTIGSFYTCDSCNAVPNLTDEIYTIGGTLSANSQMAEIIVYNRALSDNERESVEKYLDGKYSLY
jgi:hypothetical protein